jgi:uncharacterized protein with HEPN domain
MSKIDDLTRLKHIIDSAKEALSFVNNRTREDLDHERMLSRKVQKNRYLVTKSKVVQKPLPSCLLPPALS